MLKGISAINHPFEINITTNLDNLISELDHFNDDFVELQKLIDRLQKIIPDFRNIKKCRGLVQQPQNYPLTKRNRNRRHADIYILIPFFNFNASVLGQPFFRDIHPGHHLDSGNQCRLNPFGRLQQIV